MLNSIRQITEGDNFNSVEKKIVVMQLEKNCQNKFGVFNSYHVMILPRRAWNLGQVLIDAILLAYRATVKYCN